MPIRPSASPIPGTQFPVEAYDNYIKQIVPRWLSTDDAIIAAYIALVDKVCPCVLLFHSQAGGFGFTVAQARPDKIKAIVAVEPAVAGDKAQAGELKNIPVLVVYGDNIPIEHPRWAGFKKLDPDYADAMRAAGGKPRLDPEMADRQGLGRVEPANRRMH